MKFIHYFWIISFQLILVPVIWVIFTFFVDDLLALFAAVPISILFGYWLVKNLYKCESCGGHWCKSENGQETIERYVKYKQESTEIGGTNLHSVPYNVRRYKQYYICGNCNHESYEVKVSESKN